MKKPFTALAAILAIAAPLAHAEICDYRPSELIGGESTAAATVATAAPGVTGAGMKAAGYYSITHSMSGAAMLGSTAPGASAAGTVGILPGTAGWIGTAGAVVLSTPVIVGAVLTIIGVGSFEGLCFLTED